MPHPAATPQERRQQDEELLADALPKEAVEAAGRRLSPSPSPWESAEERRAYYAEASEAAMASPARAMQRVLGAEFDVLPGEERWPLRRTVALVFATCGAFWTMVYFLVAALIG